KGGNVRVKPPRRRMMSSARTHPDTPWSDMTPRAPRPFSTLTEAQTTRRQLLALATVGGAGVAGIAAADETHATPATPSAATGKPDHVLTVLGTTDLHGNVYN
ncbi:MAG: hypothetical protein ABJA74_14290, partial [Lapillicoccus sp.]